MNTSRFHVTYDVVTPESAERGDSADNGFIARGGYRVSLEGIHGPAVSEVAKDCAMRLREALELVGCFDTGSDGFTYYGADAYTDYRTGAAERRDFHLPYSATPSSVRRVRRVLEKRRLV